MDSEHVVPAQTVRIRAHIGHTKWRLGFNYAFFYCMRNNQGESSYKNEICPSAPLHKACPESRLCNYVLSSDTWSVSLLRVTFGAKHHVFWFPMVTHYVFSDNSIWQRTEIISYGRDRNLKKKTLSSKRKSRGSAIKQATVCDNST